MFVVLNRSKIPLAILLSFGFGCVEPSDNGTCDLARPVVELPFEALVETSGETGLAFCSQDAREAAWYRFDPPRTGSFCAHTCGSGYKTVVDVFRGPSCAKLDHVACGAESQCNRRGRVDEFAVAGEPQFIRVAQDELRPQNTLLHLVIAYVGDDSDGDGIEDCEDVCPGVPDPDQADSDRNGWGSTCEDKDFDGRTDGADNCPQVVNPDQANQDDDDQGDACDNCTLVPNSKDSRFPFQEDGDGDRIGNACDADFNQDNFVGGPDFDTFLQCFNRTVALGVGPFQDPSCNESDMNSDGFVGGPDFDLFLGQFDGPPGPSSFAPFGPYCGPYTDPYGMPYVDPSGSPYICPDGPSPYNAYLAANLFGRRRPEVALAALAVVALVVMPLRQKRR